MYIQKHLTNQYIEVQKRIKDKITNINSSAILEVKGRYFDPFGQCDVYGRLV